MENKQNEDKVSRIRMIITFLIVAALVIYAKFFWK